MAIHMKMILLSLVMLLIAFEPAFSGKILKKLDKELKKMGLQKLQNFLADIGTNADEIDSNKAHFDNIAVGLAVDIATNADEIDSNKVHIDNNAVDIGTLKTSGSGSVWFDAWRTTNMETGSASLTQHSWTDITYTDVRESSSYSGAMDVGTGVFTAPLAGTYQFIIQAYKFPGTYCALRITRDGGVWGFGTTISRIDDNDKSNGATSGGTAIIEMQPGQKVWAMTAYKLQSWVTGESGLIHFTGVLITPKYGYPYKL